MELGAFSISLAVKDIAASRAFYEKLGFTGDCGGVDQKWMILRNGEATIGLFEGMFEGNILTFNPGIGQDMSMLPEFTDVRELQDRLQEQGVELQETVDPESSGPAHVTLLDPDGNAILIDQHR